MYFLNAKSQLAEDRELSSEKICRQNKEHTRKERACVESKQT